MLHIFAAVKKFPRTFWTANSMELFERWAYYGVFNLLALYLTSSTETGALGFTQVEKGLLMGTVNAILYFLPIITGAIADKLGYKKMLVISYVILSSGYLLMGYTSSFAMVFLSFFYVAIGAALFKPIISATIAQTTDEDNSSLGFGFFYMIVNIGGLIGPVMASELREISWKLVFISSSAAIGINLILVLLFYKEPQRLEKQENLGKTITKILKNIIHALGDTKLLLFLIIIVGFWTVFWQYFYSLPVFIEQWTKTGMIYQGLYSVWPGFANAVATSDGTILAEKIIALDALFIIIFQIVVSSIAARSKPLSVMTTGILVNGLGIVLAMLTRNGWFVIFAIFIFSIGEMAASPKILEYIGRIAPKKDAALYMGTQYVSVAIGNFIGGFIAGPVYGNMADKIVLVKKDLIERGIQVPELSAEFTKTHLLERAREVTGLSATDLDHYLWNTYQPFDFVWVLAGISVLTFVSLFLYNRFILNPRS
ncbi:MAG: MFS transporter [Bacteroidales bacterium]